MARQGGVMGYVWLTVCLFALLAATVQSEHHPQALGKRLGPGSPPSSVGEARLGGLEEDDDDDEEESQEDQEGARSSHTNNPLWGVSGGREHKQHKRSEEGNMPSSWLALDGDRDGAGSSEDRAMTVAGRSSNFGGSGGTFWVSRGKKASRDYLPFYWGSNQNMWGETPFRRWSSPEVVEAPTPQQRQQVPQPSPRHQLHSGWESNQSLWGKRDGRGPFWIARGKRQQKREGSGGPFWISRGKRNMDSGFYWSTNPWTLGKRGHEEDAVGDDDYFSSFWKDDDMFFNKRQDGGPFWISRGKKSDTSALPPLGEPASWADRGRKSEDNKTFWVARGKKEVGDTAPFWIARGKRGDGSNDSTLFWITRGKKDGEAPPFWVARGKKDGEAPPFWVARGKKEEESHPFWVARGKKEGDTHPFWIARGKKETERHPFWVARGKKEKESHPFWVARGKKEEESHPFWIARGKKESDRAPYWVSRGRREDPWLSEDTSLGDEEDNEDPVMNYVLQALLLENQNDTVTGGATQERQDHQEPKGKKDSRHQPGDDPFVKGFVALRG